MFTREGELKLKSQPCNHNVKLYLFETMMLGTLIQLNQSINIFQYTKYVVIDKCNDGPDN